MKVLENLGSQIVLYPSCGLRLPTGGYRLQLAGCAYQHGEITLRKKLLLRLLRSAMRVDPHEMASEVFQSRIKPFMDRADRGQAIQLEIGEQVVYLDDLTRRNGHFRSSIEISEDRANQLAADRLIENEQLSVRASLVNSDCPSTLGQIELIPPTGLSVISDIDDTIKVSNVGNLSQLLTNTFLREFQEVEGMSAVYRSWADLGARFHYVSSSPWQLFQPLVNLRVRGKFPHGSFHLREFRWRDQMFGRIRRPQYRGKAVVIHSLLRSMPQRKFVLIGDSGEHDPEIYQRVCQRYPAQILGLFIRQIGRRPLADKRLRKLSNQIENVAFGVFSSAEELARLAAPAIRSFHTASTSV